MELQAETGQQGRKLLGADAVKPRGMFTFSCLHGSPVHFTLDGCSLCLDCVRINIR